MTAPDDYLGDNDEPYGITTDLGWSIVGNSPQITTSTKFMSGVFKDEDVERAEKQSKAGNRWVL